MQLSLGRAFHQIEFDTAEEPPRLDTFEWREELHDTSRKVLTTYTLTLFRRLCGTYSLIPNLDLIAVWIGDIGERKAR